MKASVKYSQNFLKSSSLIKSLIEKSSIGQRDVVYEIGAGLGVITSELEAHCKEVVAVEADTRLFESLSEKFGRVPNVKLIKGNFLAQLLPDEPYKVFSNIPFNITADIIHKLVEAKNPPKDSYLFIQKEAAKKFMGKPYSSTETQLSLLIKLSFELVVVHQFGKSDFQPSPAVDVVLLRIKQLEQPLVDEISQYQDFITHAFNAKKPSLKKALDKIFTHNQFKRLAKDLGFSLEAKPTELDFEQWLGLYRYYDVGVIDDKKQIIQGAVANLKNQQLKLDKVHRTRTAKNWLRA